MKIVSVLEAKNQLSRLIRSVQGGDEVVIANRGAPVARLSAVESARSAQGSAETILAHLRTPARRTRTAREIDRAIAAERKAWD